MRLRSFLCTFSIYTRLPRRLGGGFAVDDFALPGRSARARREQLVRAVKDEHAALAMHPPHLRHRLLAHPRRGAQADGLQSAAQALGEGAHDGLRRAGPAEIEVTQTWEAGGESARRGVTHLQGRRGGAGGEWGRIVQVCALGWYTSSRRYVSARTVVG